MDARLRLRIAPDPRFGRQVREQVVAFAATLDITEPDLEEFLTALGEALANAIEHSRVAEPIEISLWLVDSDKLIATVVDRGVGFQPKNSAVSEPSLPDSFAERGRGLPIMRSCADIFSVRSAPGQGTSVTLGRRIRRTGAPAKLRYAAG